MQKNEIAKMMDHTILKAVATKSDVQKVCKEALELDTASVCINPYYIKLAKELLDGSDVKVCTVIGFPLGANTSETKAFETKDAVEKGAQEIDMVINIGALLAGDEDAVYNDIKAVVDAAAGNTTKVIIETCYLNDEQKKLACELSLKAGATFVKTSTGFGTGGATPHDVELMRSVVKDKMQVKASGGVRTYEDAIDVINAGADRLGVSSSMAIIEGIK